MRGIWGKVNRKSDILTFTQISYFNLLDDALEDHASGPRKRRSSILRLAGMEDDKRRRISELLHNDDEHELDNI